MQTHSPRLIEAGVAAGCLNVVFSSTCATYGEQDGVTLDEKLAAKYPYDPMCLPVARLEDGTLWNW